MRVRIHVYHHLLAEIRVIVFRIQVQGFAEQGNIGGSTCAIVPGLILVKTFGDVYPAAACQQVVILGQHMVRAVSLSCRKTEMYILVGIVLHMETRGDEIAVLAAMVAADATHQHQFIVPVVGVLHVGAGDGFFGEFLRQRLCGVIVQAVVLVVGVIVEAQSGRKALTLGQFRLEQQGGISVVLVHIVDFPSVQGILLVQGAGKNQCQVGVLLLIKYIGVLGEGFVAVGTYTYLIRVCQGRFAMADLPAVAVFCKHFDACLEDVAVAHVCPAVPEVVLLHTGDVGKAVVVAVVSFGLILVMRQQRGAPTFGEFHRGIGIGFITVGAAGKEVGGEPIGFGQLGFLEFHIDLSRDGLIAVLHGRTALAHLNALHPWPGDIAQAVGGGRAAVVGDILRHHLHIRAGQAQKLDLLGTGGGVRISDVHRGIGHKTLSQVTAGGTTQLGATYHIFIHHTVAQLHGAQLTADHIHLAQFHPFAQDNVERLIAVTDVYRIVLKTDKADYKHMLVIGFGQGESTVRRSGGALSGSLPEEVGTRNRVAQIILYRPLYLRLQGGEREQKDGYQTIFHFCFILKEVIKKQTVPSGQFMSLPRIKQH